MANQNDKRVKYTKMFLRQALLDLMKEKPISKITPTELCRKAEINRNTFYTHYMSPEDVLYEIENDIIESFRLTIAKRVEENRSDVAFYELCKAIRDNEDFYIILSSGVEFDFLFSIIECFHDISVEQWKKANPTFEHINPEPYFEFCTGGCIAVIYMWIISGFKESPQEVADKLSKMNNGLILSAE